LLYYVSVDISIWEVVMLQMVMSSKELGIMLRDLRKKQGLTQTELGRRVGLDQKKVSLIENGNPNVRLDTLFRLLSSLGYGMALQAKMAESTEEDSW
jgi:HTH-type transcriptional regulator / antitoxin HipB